MKQLLKQLLHWTATFVFFAVAFLVTNSLLTLSFWPALFASLLVSLIFYFTTRQKKVGKKQASPLSKELPQLSAEQDAFYREQGMSKDEIQFFRETMNAAKNQILILEQNMNYGTKLKTIESRNNTIQLTKALFKSITDEPKRLHKVDKFLYSHLPSLVDLTEKYIEISKHEIKNKATFDVLEKSATTIDEMCQLIAIDYSTFKEDDLEDMDIEIALANQTIERDNERNEEEIEKEER